MSRHALNAKPRVSAASLIEQAKAGIVYHAQECEAALRLAHFASSDPLMRKHDSPQMATGLNKLAAYHSEHAFRWAATLARAQGGVA